ncbi:MAG: PDZ domain-containing protein [Myxococcota bacterium]
MSAPIRYRVSMPRPHSHLFEVEASFPPAGETLTVCLPVWTPGSYLVREYARHVQEFKVVDEAGFSVPFERADKRSFLIRAANKPVRCVYKVYANELTVRTSHLDGTHGYFNGATLFFYAEVLRRAEHRVTVEPFADWRVSVALPMSGREYVARDYDELVDSPFEVGPHTPIPFTAAGVPHEVVLWGEPQLDEKKLVADFTRLIETEATMFGGLPMQRYVFIVHATDKGRGGLEHKASTVLLFPRSGFSSPKGWEDFLTLAAHEYFHLWNVKRVKPRRLVPFDYAQENYTQLLWWFEGCTSYYDNLVTRRAGLMTAPRYLTRLGESFTSLHTTPGRLVLPLVDASMIAWTKHYRPDENTPNTAVSYYLKGELVCALLDLTIRQATKDERSLDDVQRLLWKRFGDESGVPEDGVEAAAQEVAGINLKPFFDRALRSVDELDLSVLSHVGLEAKFRPRESTGDKGGTPPRNKGEKNPGYLGVATKGSSTIATVFDGSPAMQAGIYADDEVVALDGFKCDAGQLLSRCEDKRPGETVKLTLFRRDRLLEVPVVLGARPADAVWLARVENPTDAQKAAYQAWLGAPWDADAAPVETAGRGV